MSRDRKNIPVHNVSFVDAQAYCEWTKGRLPTEAEWVAAALIDQRVMSPRDHDKFLFGKTGTFDRIRFPDALHDVGTEWIVGDAPPGRAVVRFGPTYVREVGCEQVRNREVVRVNAYDLMLGFRVCHV